jgi:hypothetical protein
LPDQLPEVRPLHGDTAYRSIRQHIDYPPPAGILTHDVIQIMPVTGNRDDLCTHDLFVPNDARLAPDLLLIGGTALL